MSRANSHSMKFDQVNPSERPPKRFRSDDTNDHISMGEGSLIRATAHPHVDGVEIRPMTKIETSDWIVEDGAFKQDGSNSEQGIIARKLRVTYERPNSVSPFPRLEVTPGTTEPGDCPIVSPLPPQFISDQEAQTSAVLQAFCQIRSTPYECSFLSRLHGCGGSRSGHIFAVDWETISPWMRLMGDVRAHHALLHADRQQPSETLAPIVYMCLQDCHLEQVHDLLRRVFWAGISVRDSLDYCPERCTVVATYKRLVVGVAILSSPHETYITYLAVKAGWEGTKIATAMLYYLIKTNPNKDISLHVSANNPAMLLYNRFGFKAEEFVVGFYEDYLDAQSHASNNAFRLRLRHDHRI